MKKYPKPKYPGELIEKMKQPSKKAAKRAFHEVYKKTPAIVKHTAKKFGKKRAEEQRVAIALNKARKGY